MRDALDGWTNAIFPKRRARRGGTIVLGGCGFWLLVILFVQAFNLLRVAVWLVGALLIVLWFGFLIALPPYDRKGRG